MNLVLNQIPRTTHVEFANFCRTHYPNSAAIEELLFKFPLHSAGPLGLDPGPVLDPMNSVLNRTLDLLKTFENCSRRAFILFGSVELATETLL